MKSLHMAKYWRTAGLLIIIALLGPGCFNLTASAETAVINASSVYVRSGPGTTYGILGSLSKNTGIDVLERQGGWVKISFKNKTGWVAEYLTVSGASTVQAGPRMFINGNSMAFNTAPVTVDGKTLMPLKEMFENLGATVTWNASSQTITARKSSTAVTFTIGSPSAAVNGQVRRLDVPVQIVNGQTFAPLWFMVEALGGKTVWDEDNQAINIYCPSDPRDQLTAVSISASDLNIRNGPSISADKIGMAPCGTILAYAGEQDGWYQVKYQGQSGWVASWLVVPLWNTAVPSRGGKGPVLLPMPADHQSFVRQMKPYAETANKGTGLPVDLLLAQWAEESGYGTSSLAQYYNNFGGIKGSDSGGFKKYDSPDEFAQDVIAIYTQHSNYSRLLADARAGASISTLINDLASCGYASSGNYGQKIRTVYLPEIDSILGTM